MNNVRAGLRRRRFWPGIVIILLTVGFIATPPCYAGIHDTDFRNYCFIGGGVVLAAAAGYAIWLNRPGSNFSWESKGPGGFYIGAGGGANFVGATNWKIQVPGTTINKTLALTASPLFNTKLGYFFHQFPYLGLEGDLNYTRNKLRQQTFPLATHWFNITTASFSDTFDNVSFVLRVMGRYGFLPDSEIPFGRLQPYVGIGPGMEVALTQDGTLKTLALEASAGVKYMFLKNFSTYVEYKYAYQMKKDNPRTFEINGGPGKVIGEYFFDYTRHMVVGGFAYHFL